MSGVTVSGDGIVTGNTYDKYNARNPIARLLQRGFERNLEDLLDSTQAQSLLDARSALITAANS